MTPEELVTKVALAIEESDTFAATTYDYARTAVRIALKEAVQVVRETGEGDPQMASRLVGALEALIPEDNEEN